MIIFIWKKLNNCPIRLPILIIAFSIGLLILGCNSESSKGDIGQKKNTPDTGKNKGSNDIVDSLKSNSDLEKGLVRTPSILLLDMAQYLDSLGYGCDLKFDCQNKVAEPCVCELRLQKHPVENTIYKYKLGYDNIDLKTIKRDLIRKVIVINAFPYSIKKKGKDINPDGIIEEWVYENENVAEEAGMEWNRIRNFIFHHTTSYICRTKNRLYILHNRAAFDQIHRQTIKRFKSRFDVEYPTTIPNAGR